MSQVIINLLLGVASFGFLFSSLVMDLFDKKHCNYFDRVIYFLGILFNVAYLLRVGVPEASAASMYWWFAMTGLMFARKLYQLLGRGERFDERLKKNTRIFHRSLMSKSL